MERFRAPYLNDVLLTVMILLQTVTQSVPKAVLLSMSDSNSDVPLSCQSFSSIHDLCQALCMSNVIVLLVLHHYRVMHAKVVLDKELGYWVLPHSIAWFSQFLLYENMRTADGLNFSVLTKIQSPI